MPKYTCEWNKYEFKNWDKWKNNPFPEPEIIETSDGTSIMNRNFVITDNKIIINKIDMINKKNPEKHLILKNKYCEYCKLMDTCNKLIGCECKSGWTGEFCDTKGI